MKQPTESLIEDPRVKTDVALMKKLQDRGVNDEDLLRVLCDVSTSNGNGKGSHNE